MSEGTRYQVLDLQSGEVVGESKARPPALTQEETDLLAGVLIALTEEAEMPDWERSAYRSALSKLDHRERDGGTENSEGKNGEGKDDGRQDSGRKDSGRKDSGTKDGEEEHD